MHQPERAAPVHGTRTRRQLASLDAWLRDSTGGPPLAVVLGASVNGLSFVRSLGRRGVPVLLVDADPLVGTYSRFAKHVCVPADEHESAALLELLQCVGRRLRRRGVLFLTGDKYCLFAAEHADLLRRWYQFLQPEAATVRAIVDKSEQYRVAREVGVPLPETFFPTTALELDDAARRVRYPAILKPHRNDRRPHAMKEKQIKVIVAHSADELRAGYARMADVGLEVMVQEVIGGDDSALYGYWGFWDAEGRERAWLTKRKLRQSPPLFGDGSLQQTVAAPEVAELSRRLLRAFNYRGFVGVEFKRDPRDGAYRLMEINPRTESGNQLAIAAGVDFPWIGYQYFTGVSLPVESETQVAFTPGVTYVNEEWDLKAFLALRQSGTLSAGDWLRSWRGAKAYAIGAWDDPLPLLVIAGRIARAAARRGLRLGR